MSTLTTKSTKIRAGLYSVTVAATMTYEVERAWDGRGWHVYEQTDGYRGEWCNWFATKWEAIESLATW